MGKRHLAAASHSAPRLPLAHCHENCQVAAQWLCRDEAVVWSDVARQPCGVTRVRCAAPGDGLQDGGAHGIFSSDPAVVRFLSQLLALLCVYALPTCAS